MSKELELLKKKLAREEAARQEAEKLLEQKSLELYRSNVQLQDLNANLESLVEKRTLELRESELEYQTMVESINDMIFRLDLKGNIQFVNQVVGKVFGVASSNLLGKNILELIPEEKRSTIFRYFTRQFLTRNCINYYEVEVETQFKQKIWLRLNVQYSSQSCISCVKKQHSVSGGMEKIQAQKHCKFNEIIIVGHDITQKKKNEQEVVNNLRQQQILSKISISFNTLDKINDKINAALEIIGKHTNVSRVYVFEDVKNGLLTRNTFEWCNKGITSQIENLQDFSYSLVPSWNKLLQEDAKIMADNISKLPKDICRLLENQSIESILVLPLKDKGEKFGFIGFDECNCKRLWKESEIELLKTIANIFSNAFLRQKLEKELRESEQRNRVLVNSIPDAILLLGKSGQIKSIKTSDTSSLLNKRVGEKRESLFDIIEKKLIPQFEVAISICLNKGHFKFDFKSLNWDQVEYYEARLVKLSEENLMIIIRDHTQVIERQQKLEIAMNKAEEASLIKSQFLANVSHELKTPLNAILGFGQWLFENTDINLHKGYLSSILKSGRELLDTINDILDISKLESGKLDLDEKPMSYAEIVSDIKMYFQETIENNEIDFIIDTDESVPETILLDDLRFYQVIFNLVSNAVKYTKKGFVSIRAFASNAKNEDTVDIVVAVEDSGIGIEQDKQSTIFESFVSLSGGESGNYQGAGLGLALTKGLVEKLNGKIELQSEKGVGTSFKLTFFDVKIGKSDYTKINQKQHKKTHNLGACSIMIVDDIAYNITVLKALIGSRKVHYIEASDGASALSMLSSERPDIIFMDIRMPGLDGFEVTKIIKQDALLKEIPVIAFSASTVKNKTELLKHEFDGYLQKPVFRNELDEILITFLGDKIEDVADEKPGTKKASLKLKADELQNLPALLEALNSSFVNRWEEIKDNLVIYEIENFKKDLESEAHQSKFSLLMKYCDELNLGLQTFDIELIERKLKDFPQLIEQMKTMLEESAQN